MSENINEISKNTKYFLQLFEGKRILVNNTIYVIKDIVITTSNREIPKLFGKPKQIEIYTLISCNVAFYDSIEKILHFKPIKPEWVINLFNSYRNYKFREDYLKMEEQFKAFEEFNKTEKDE